LDNQMGYVKRTALAALAALAVTAALAALAVRAAPAQAGEVIVVKGGKAERVQDPSVPSRGEIELGMPVGGAGPLGFAPARVSARASRESARASRAWRIARSSSKRGRRAVYRSLSRELRRTRIASADYRRWRRYYVLSIRALRKLRGARRTQLRYVTDSVEALALARRLTRTRMPVAFVQLERNRQYWRKLPYPAAGDQVSFSGSQILYQYFPGEGLQLHPLSTFKKANHLHGFCERGEPTCDQEALRVLLDEMTALAVQRGRSFIAWEYLFHFGGGAPPWMSGMAQATGIQAYARASRLLGRPDYVETARSALGAFETLPPRGVRTTGPAGGIHYLQYSFAPRLWIFNAFFQSLIGLYDYAKISGDERARTLYAEAEPEAREEVPLSDVGDWSRYSYAGNESSADYHELLREFLQSMCSRRLGPIYCDYAKRYRGYQVDPPVLDYLGPALANEGEATRIPFTLSKLSAVELTIERPDGRVAYSRLATFRRGTGSFTWTPKGPGFYTVRLAAKELRTGLGKKDRASGEIEVANLPG
jgi:D-glucuronyl C5-epimerase C-terminus